MIEAQELAPVAASLVAEGDRLSFLPAFFGERMMMRGESLVYGWMDRLSEDYNGGFWHYYTLSNGGFYMAPATEKRMRMAVEGNGYEGEMSADAAGIVATMFALCQLAAETEDDHIIDLYHLLRAFLDDHPEGGLIFRAID